MFPNLDAEQARRKLTNAAVAAHLGISRGAYERRKKTGRFLADECQKLCSLFCCEFGYLFSPSQIFCP